MRECRKNFAHGPMKLQTKNVVIEYRGQEIACEKTVYTCQFCDYELHEKWMEEKRIRFKIRDLRIVQSQANF